VVGHHGGNLVRYPLYDQALVLPPYSRNPPPLILPMMLFGLLWHVNCVESKNDSGKYIFNVPIITLDI